MWDSIFNVSDSSTGVELQYRSVSPEDGKRFRRNIREAVGTWSRDQESKACRQEANGSKKKYFHHN